MAGRDVTKNSRSLAIALVFGAVFFVAACGLAAWMLVQKPATTTVQNIPTDDVATVTKVSFIAPATLPANYVMTDQSTRDVTNTYYYDDATNCGITIGISAVPANKTIKDTVADAITAAQTQGVTTASKTDGSSYSIKDTDGKHTYSFSSVNLDQNVSVQGVNFTKQNNVLLYKQFGNQIASISYACKSDTWPQKKDELAGLVKAFTVKTER